MGRARLEVNRGFYAAAGKKICDERTRKRMTQEGLAKQVTLTRTSIINIEKGRQQILLHTLVDIARSLGVEPALLIPKELPAQGATQPDVQISLANNSSRVRAWVQSGLEKIRKVD